MPDELALWQEYTSITFANLYHGALAAAEPLRELNIKTGDRAGVCMEKSVAQVLVILHILFANAVLVPSLPRLKGPNGKHIVENSRMAAMITDSQRLVEVE